MFNRKLVEDFFSRERKFEGVERELKVGGTNKIISIVGPRRSGKTWFFYYLKDKTRNSCCVNFEDIAFRNLEVNEFFEIIKIFSELKYKPFSFFLDEIQVIEDWQILTRSLYDRGYRVFITGSSSKLLGKEIATQLRGRVFNYVLFPFSFREFLKTKKFKPEVHLFEDVGCLLRLLKEYLRFGAFPEVVLGSEKEKVLKQYADEIFYKDFVERHKIKSMDFGRFLFEFAFQNFSKEVSLRKIKGFFRENVSDTTLYSYVEKLKDTVSVFFLDRFSKSVYTRLSWPKKIYVCDIGLSDVLGFSPDMGKKMENVIFLELIRKTNEKPLLGFYYWKDYQGKEVDFVVKEGTKVKELIQVTYASGRDEIEKREIRGLLKAGKELKCKNLLVITWDYEDEEAWDGRKIRFVPLWKWLV
ncbi:MAG: hypothetical protein DRP13_02415 [Candidatus Aenigmatarchaeota archaeon]|nr:MAG: hypothetical protein DRP13_02415 [Candidatus Aenigmarchaeota archaeon]